MASRAQRARLFQVLKNTHIHYKIFRLPVAVYVSVWLSWKLHTLWSASWLDRRSQSHQQFSYIRQPGGTFNTRSLLSPCLERLWCSPLRAHIQRCVQTMCLSPSDVPEMNRKHHTRYQFEVYMQASPDARARSKCAQTFLA